MPPPRCPWATRLVYGCWAESLLEVAYLTHAFRTSAIMLRSAPRMATSGRLPEFSIRLRTSIPHDRPAIRASMSQTSTKGRSTSVCVSGESSCTPACGPQTRPSRLISAALAGRLLLTAWVSTTPTPIYMTDGKEESTNDARCEGTVRSVEEQADVQRPGSRPISAG